MKFFDDRTFKIDCNICQLRNTFIPEYWKRSSSVPARCRIRTHGINRRNIYITTTCGDEIIALWNGAILPPHLFYKDDIRAETSVSTLLAVIIIRLITRPVDTAIKTRYDRNVYTCAGAAPIATHDRSLIASSFPGRLIRLIAVEPTIIGQKAQRDLCGPTRPPVRGLTRTEARFVIVSRRGWTFIVLPRAPVAMRFQRGRR